MRSSASAPGKVILLGEHFVLYGTGAVVCAINRRVTIHAEETAGRQIRITSSLGTFEGEPGMDARGVDAVLRPLYHIADAALQSRSTGLSMDVSSEIPPGAGLGSSSACCVAGAAAVSGLFSEVTREGVLELASAAERTVFAGASGADCAACTYGGVITYWDGGFEGVGAGPGLEMVVADSGEAHSTASMVEKVAGFKESDPESFARMREAEAELVRGAPAMIGGGDAAGLGKSMNQNQEYLEAVGVSTPRLREMARIGREHSAGAKITGAGGGGCVVALGAEEAFREGGYGCFAARIDADGLIVFN